MLEPFNEILKNIIKKVQFENALIYFAHRQPNKNKETLLEHIEKVSTYFINICEANKLEAIVDKLIEDIQGNDNTPVVDNAT